MNKPDSKSRATRAASERIVTRAGAMPRPPEPGFEPPPPTQRFFNRDLSWLEFNRRVLAQAADRRTPLLDRVRFLCIFTSNLDEFFMKRVGLIKRAAHAGVEKWSPDGLTPRQLLVAIRAQVLDVQEIQSELLEREILPELSAHDIHVVGYKDLTARERSFIDEWYRVNVFPALTPLAVDPGHRFPFISNLSDNLAVLVEPHEGVAPAFVGGGSVAAEAEDCHFARVKIPHGIRRFVPLPRPGSARADRFVPLVDVVRHNLDDVFPGVTIRELLHFRVTRSAGVQRDERLERSVEEGDADILQFVEAELKQRRFARVVRMECEPDPSHHLLRQLVDKLNIDNQDVYARRGLIDYASLLEIADLDRPDLKEKRWRAVTPARLALEKASDIFGVIRRQDVLLHHPYESFDTSVERFIEAAAVDPDVLTIKQTLYRTSPDSPFVESLIRAAESGKQVACLVEVRARFDESRNVKFVRQLQRAGVHVAYGVLGLKTHSKTSMVVRRERQGLRVYAHIGTGNYHPKTAQLYTDVGLLTCDPELTGDLVSLFNYLTGLAAKQSYTQLLVAPFNMRARFIELINREIAHARRKAEAGDGALPGGRIIAKINSMEDVEIAERLYAASQAGVKIILIVRGFCCVRPGLAGLSENISVVSVIGRFLEHSRIFHFGAGEVDPLEGDWYISSADWMHRNLNSRVEAAAPVRDRVARTRLKRIIDVMLADHRNAWDMQPDGSYTLRTVPEGAPPDSPEALGTFATLMRDALGPRAG